MGILSSIGKFLGGPAGAAIGSIGGSLIGGLFGNNAANKAASAQLQATRDTNAMNYKIWQEQMAYNSPVAQRKRLEEAGLNPYLMMNGGSAGVMQSAPQMQSPDLSALHSKAQVTRDSIANAIPSGMQALRDIVSTQRAQEETQSIKLQNDFAAMSLASRVAEAAANARGADARSSMLQLQKSILGRTQNYLVERERLDNNFKMAQVETQLQQVTLNEFAKEESRLRIGVLPQVLNQQLAESAARIYLLGIQSRQGLQDIKESISREVVNQYDAAGRKISNDYASRLSAAMVSKLRAEGKLALKNAGLAERDLEDNFGFYLNRYAKGFRDAGGAINEGLNVGLKLPWLLK